MKSALLLVLSVFALSGCEAEAPRGGSPAVEPPAAVRNEVPAAPAPEGTPLTAVGDLLGEYRVAGIDGEPLDAPIGIALSIDGPMLSYEPTCAGFVWSLAFEDGRLVTARVPQQTVEPGAPPPPVCAVAVHPVLRQLAQALDAVDSATRTPDNGVVLAGRGRRVTLFSQ